MKIVKVAAAVVRRRDEVLICSRPEDKPPYGWEFPGGKVEKGETLAAAAVRELREELALTPTVLDCMYVERVRQPDRVLELYFLRCRIADGVEPECRERQRCKWVKLNELPGARLLEPDRDFVEFLSMPGQ